MTNDSNTAIIDARGLTLGYGSTTVMRDVDVRINEGELWFLLGANGTGKTSFIRAVLGLIEPQAGSIRLHPTLAARASIGFVPQRCDLNPTLRTTVGEFVSLGLVGSTTPAADKGASLATALATVGLAGEDRRDYWSLSVGLRQRALLARALVREPRVLLLDEPTSGLDPAAEELLVELLADLNTTRHVTEIVVTHDIGLAARHASHVALFHDGRVTAGRRDEVLSEENLSRAYRGLRTNITGGHA